MPHRNHSSPPARVPLKTPLPTAGFREYNIYHIQHIVPTTVVDRANLALAPATEIQSVAGNLCSDVNSADSAELASASNAINSALATGTTGTGTAAAGSTATSASGNAAARTDSPLVGMGAMGAAAALAVLAL